MDQLKSNCRRHFDSPKGPDILISPPEFTWHWPLQSYIGAVCVRMCGKGANYHNLMILDAPTLPVVETKGLSPIATVTFMVVGWLSRKNMEKMEQWRAWCLKVKCLCQVTSFPVLQPFSLDPCCSRAKPKGWNRQEGFNLPETPHIRKVTSSFQNPPSLCTALVG